LRTFLTLADFLDFSVSWTLHGLAVLYASCSLLDTGSLPDSGGPPDSLGLQTLKAVIFIFKTSLLSKESTLISIYIHVYN
jgi:hypothetical protein